MENSGMLVEQVVKREHNARYHINKVLIIFATIAIPASLVAIAFITKFPYLNVVAFFVLLFCIYGAWFFITSLEVDFEYAFLSSVFRIDKVIAKRRRRKMRRMSGAKSFLNLKSAKTVKSVNKNGTLRPVY